MQNSLRNIEKSTINENSEFVPVKYLIEGIGKEYKAKEIIENNSIDLFWEIPSNCRIDMESPFDLVSKYVDSTYNTRKSVFNKSKDVQDRYIIPLKSERYLDYVYNRFPKGLLPNSKLLLGKGRIKCDYLVLDRDGGIPHNVRALPEFADRIVPGMSSDQIKEYNDSYTEKIKSNKFNEQILKMDLQWNHIEDLFSGKQINFPFFVDSTSSLIQNKSYRNPSIFDTDKKLSLERFFYIPRCEDDKAKNESLKFTFSNVFLLKNDFEKIINQNSTNNINSNIILNQIIIHNDLDLFINQRLEQITISNSPELTLDNIRNIVEEIVKKYYKEPNPIQNTQNIMENIESKLKDNFDKQPTKDDIKSIITEAIKEQNKENKNKQDDKNKIEITEEDLEYLSLKMRKLVEIAKGGNGPILVWLKEQKEKKKKKKKKKRQSLEKI